MQIYFPGWSCIVVCFRREGTLLENDLLQARLDWVGGKLGLLGVAAAAVAFIKLLACSDLDLYLLRKGEVGEDVAVPALQLDGEQA